MVRSLSWSCDGIVHHGFVVYYELLKSSHPVTGDSYRQQLVRLKWALKQKILEWLNRQEQLILLRDNAKLHILKLVKKYLWGVSWEILFHPPNIATSDLQSFRSMQWAVSEKWLVSYVGTNKWHDEWIVWKKPILFRLLPERRKKVVTLDRSYLIILCIYLNKYVLK